MLTGSPAVISRQRWTQFLTRVLFYLASQIFISTFSQQSGALENKPHLMPIADKKVKEAAIVLSRHGRVQTISHILHGFFLYQFATSYFFCSTISISRSILLHFVLSFFLSTYVCRFNTRCLFHMLSLSQFISLLHCLLFVPIPTLFYLFRSNIVVCFLSQSLPLSHFYPFSHSQSLSLSIAHFRFHLVFLLVLIFVLLRMSW